MARGTFGERLKRERELREVTPEEIASATRIAPRFLDALENEVWEKLPGGVFNRGFVRSIARYLGLDEEAFLAEYDMAHGPEASAVPSYAEDRIPRPSKWIPAALVLGIIVLLAGLLYGGFVAWRYYQARHAQKVSTTAEGPQVSPPSALISSTDSPSGTKAAAAAGPAEATIPLGLSVSASAAAQLRVLADGAVVFDGALSAGENRRFSAVRDFEVWASDSGAVLLEMNGQTVAPLGVPGSSGTIKLSAKDLRQAERGNSKP